MVEAAERYMKAMNSINERKKNIMLDACTGMLPG